MNKEFCIMIPSEFYSTERKPGLERHECLFGKNRKKSIEDGLVVFITPYQHRGTQGVHGRDGHDFDLYLKKQAQISWCKYYNKTNDEFSGRYGKNYL